MSSSATGGDTSAAAASTTKSTASSASGRRVAVVGGGIGGLAAARMLSRAGWQVTLFEKAKSLGMDAAAVDARVQVATPPSSPRPTDKGNGDAGARRGGDTVDAAASADAVAEASVRVDVPLRVFSTGYYANLVALYRDVGVEYTPEDYSCSWSYRSDGAPFGETGFAYQNWVVGAHSFPYFGLSDLSLATLRLMFEFAHFFLVAVPRDTPAAVELAKAADAGLPPPPGVRRETLGEYVARNGYSTAFCEEVLFPGMAGMLTCSYGSIRAFPADVLILYLSARLGGGVRRAKNGTIEVVKRLSEGTEVVLNAQVAQVAVSPDDDEHVDVVFEDGSSRQFDRVVLATQANQAAALLRPSDKAAAGRASEQVADPSITTLASVLDRVAHERFGLYVHSDTSLLPAAGPAHWRSVNFSVATPRADDAAAPTASIWLNRANSSVGDLCVSTPLIETWNPAVEPDPAKCHGSASFERPCIKPNQFEIARDLTNAQGAANGRIYAVGSYARYGMPLLEAAVTSSVHVCTQHFDAPPEYGAAAVDYETAVGRAWRLRTGLATAAIVAVLSLLAVIAVLASSSPWMSVALLAALAAAHRSRAPTLATKGAK